MKAIRWSDNDRYWGPFTFSRAGHYRPTGIQLGSGDGDEREGCYLRINVFGHTLIAALPPILKPHRTWHEITTEPTRSRMIEDGRKPGYWESYNREYGFSLNDALHVHYGAQTHDSTTNKSKVFFYPWRAHRCIRHSVYDLEGELFADLPEWGFRHKNGWTVKNAIEGACPVAKFDFEDFDGERITATCMIEEREWRQGKGIFRLLYLGRNKVSRSLALTFSSEVGPRKGSWKGGTVGHSIEMLPDELHEAAFHRYCEQENLTFIAAQAREGGDEQ